MTLQTPTNNPSLKSVKSIGFVEDHREEIDEKIRQERLEQVQSEAEKNQLELNQKSKLNLKSDFNFSQDSDEEAPEIKRDKFIEDISSNRDLEESQMVKEKNQQVTEFIRRSESDQENVYTNQKSNKVVTEHETQRVALSTREGPD